MNVECCLLLDRIRSNLNFWLELDGRLYFRHAISGTEARDLLSKVVHPTPECVPTVCNIRSERNSNTIATHRLMDCCYGTHVGNNVCVCVYVCCVCALIYKLIHECRCCGFSRVTHAPTHTLTHTNTHIQEYVTTLMSTIHHQHHIL